MIGETIFRGFELRERHVLLADQIALAIALSGPAAVLGIGEARCGRIQLADQGQHLAVELGLSERQ